MRTIFARDWGRIACGYDGGQVDPEEEEDVANGEHTR
jgi:hypothetical protein